MKKTHGGGFFCFIFFFIDFESAQGFRIFLEWFLRTANARYAGGNRMIRTLWRLSREAARYRGLYTLAILSTLALTGVNLAAPRVLSAMTGIVENGVEEKDLKL